MPHVCRVSLMCRRIRSRIQVLARCTAQDAIGEHHAITRPVRIDDALTWLADKG